jgi:hypothetical protein
MSTRSRWPRLDAEHWVWVLGAAQTTLLTLVAAGGGLAVGAASAAVIPAALAGWMTAAWRRESGPAWGSGGQLLVSGVLLVLLLHPDSRGRLVRRSETAPVRG